MELRCVNSGYAHLRQMFLSHKKQPLIYYENQLIVFCMSGILVNVLKKIDLIVPKRNSIKLAN